MRRSIAVAVSLGALLFAAGTFFPPLNVRSQTAQMDAKDLARKAISLLQKSRADAEPSYLSRAEALLDQSLDLGDDNFEALVGMASLGNARHDFAGSVRWARRAISVNAHNAAPHGLLGDALFELGRYRAADRAYQDMIDIRPDMASYVRASYAYQFRGRTDAAIGAMRLALQSAGTGEDSAWIRHQLGDIYFGEGRLGAAARQNSVGTRIAPEFVPPRVGLAEVDIARGRLGRATATMERAVAALPSLEYLITLGDLYASTRRRPAARATYELARDKIHDYYEHGVRPDVDFILFFADRGIELDRTLAAARRMHGERPTAPVTDALAWTLHELGRDEDAWPLARAAASSRTHPDPVFDLHAGVIAASLGRPAAADRYLRDARSARLQLSPAQAAELRSALGQ
jgi:tetratricopeptide (TPR) repeat protein